MSSPITLRYWNARGLMDVPRMILAINGKFPNDGYTDARYFREGMPPAAEGIAEPWADADIQSKLSNNLGRMPLMEVGDDSIGQSAAINYYLSAEFGMLGDSSLEGAHIMSIQEHIKEMGAARMSVMPFGQDITPEMLEKWFTTGAEDKSPAVADGSNRERYCKWWAARIEAVVGDNGFAVGNKISLADVLIFRTFADGPQAKADQLEPMCSKAHTDAILATCPKLKKICETVGAN